MTRWSNLMIKIPNTLIFVLFILIIICAGLIPACGSCYLNLNDFDKMIGDLYVVCGIIYCLLNNISLVSNRKIILNLILHLQAFIKESKKIIIIID